MRTKQSSRRAVVGIRCTPSEKRKLLAAAKAAGLDLSGYLRVLALRPPLDSAIAGRVQSIAAAVGLTPDEVVARIVAAWLGREDAFFQANPTATRQYEEFAKEGPRPDSLEPVPASQVYVRTVTAALKAFREPRPSYMSTPEDDERMRRFLELNGPDAPR